MVIDGCCATRMSGWPRGSPWCDWTPAAEGKSLLIRMLMRTGLYLRAATQADTILG